MTNPSRLSRAGLAALRPEIPHLDLSAATNPVEQFQNEVLRPVLKFQNDLLVAAFRHQLTSRKVNLRELSPQAREKYVSTTISKDQHLRNFLLGILVGQFTLPEYERYLTHEKAIRKRATALTIQRLQDQLAG